MKYSLLFILLLLAAPSAFSQFEEDFDAGNKHYYENLCWDFEKADVKDSQPINGERSVRTDKLGNKIGIIISPWVNLAGTGNLIFKHRIYNFNVSKPRNLKVYIISETNPSGDLIMVRLC